MAQCEGSWSGNGSVHFYWKGLQWVERCKLFPIITPTLYKDIWYSTLLTIPPVNSSLLLNIDFQTPTTKTDFNNYTPKKPNFYYDRIVNPFNICNIANHHHSTYNNPPKIRSTKPSTNQLKCNKTTLKMSIKNFLNTKATNQPYCHKV